MSGMTNKIKGGANEAVGAVKQKVGELIGDPELEGEGIAQKMKGKGQRVVGDATEAATEAFESVKQKSEEIVKDTKDAVRRAVK